MWQGGLFQVNSANFPEFFPFPALATLEGTHYSLNWYEFPFHLCVCFLSYARIQLDVQDLDTTWQTKLVQTWALEFIVTDSLGPQHDQRALLLSAVNLSLVSSAVTCKADTPQTYHAGTTKYEHPSLLIVDATKISLGAWILFYGKTTCRSGSLKALRIR